MSLCAMAVRRSMEACRDEVRAFLAEHLTADVVERMHATGTFNDKDFNGAMAEAGRGGTGPEFLQAEATMGRWRRELATWWEDFDILLTPTTSQPAPRLGELSPTEDELSQVSS